MKNKDNTDLSKTPLDDLMIAEFNRVSSLFLDNEQLGERRLNILIGLVTAVTTVLGLTNLAQTGQYSEQNKTIYYFGLFALIVLVIFGMVTLKRIIHRNVVTDKYKYQLDTIRTYFGQKYKTDRDKIYDPIFIFENEGIESRTQKKKASLIDWGFGRGGILETIELLNNYLIGLIGLLLLVMILNIQPSNTGLYNIILSFVVFGILFLVAWVIQNKYTFMLYEAEENEAKKKNNIIYKKVEDKGISSFGPS
jgi:hypothetical protein